MANNLKKLARNENEAAYDLEKLTKLRALQQLAEQIKSSYASKEELKEAVDAKISSIYRAGGSVPPDELPELKEENVGLVVNVNKEFTTTDSFVEGKGKKYPAGTNIVVTGTDGNYQYDVLGGLFDLSGYIATDEEVAAMLKEVFAPEDEEGAEGDE